MIDLFQARRESHEARELGHEFKIQEGGVSLEVPRVEGQAFYPSGDAPRMTRDGTPMENIKEGLADLPKAVGSAGAGLAAGAAGLPGDVVALAGGLAKFMFPGDQGRIEAAAETLNKISETAGSEFFLGLYRDFVNNSDASLEDKQMMLDVAEGASFGSIPGAGVVAKGSSDAIRSGVVRAGEAAQARLDEAAGSTTLTSGVDVGKGIDQAIAAVGKLVATPEERVPLNMVEGDVRAHKTPPQLLVNGNGEKATVPVTQAFNANNKLTNFENIDTLSAQHPNALQNADNWLAMEQAAMGGKYLPAPPLQAIRYAQDVNLMAAKLKQLTPELKAGVDEGFQYVNQIRDIYKSGSADPKMTADMFVWGILSRGAGPTQQEAAFLDIMEDAQPFMQKVVDGTFSEADAADWVSNMKKSLPEGSPGKQVTMNVNAAGGLLRELAKVPEGSNQTVLETLHEMLSDETVSAKMIRRKFMELTDSAGIDNKVVSFVLLVAGRDDVLVMDRIQGRHLWDDGRFDGFNIYDGYYKEGTTVQEGLHGIFRGPRGVLVTEMLEDGMRPNVQKAYEMVGRPEDASLGRFHWETWVIEGEQVVSHSTLDSIAKNNPVGGSVTEGKTDEFASGFRYIRGQSGPVQEYPISDGSKVYMTPVRAKEFLAYIKKPKSGIVPNGFKVTERADIPWYERPEVDREALDKAARDYANADENGRVLRSSKGSDESQNPTGRSDRKRSVGSGASDGGV
tara:strand:+ start:920 stop:3127 length:2208 start_codon:yes stop_codon:yes gene_type:complete